MTLDPIVDIAREACQEAFDLKPETVALDIPQDRSFGDLTLNAFLLARELRQAPPKIAAAMAEKMAGRAPVLEAEAVKGFVNLKLDPAWLAEAALKPALDAPESFGSGEELSGQRLMVEYSAPNTNKPQHLGHMRNNFLGDSLARLLDNAGADVIRANLFNDRGIQICKSMLAYSRFAEGATPESTGRKGDHFVGHWYVEFERRFQEQREAWTTEHPEHYTEWKEKHGKDRKGRPIDEEKLEKNYKAWFREEGFALIPLGKECQEMLLAWEAGDAEVHALWETMNAWAIAGFQRTYADLGVRFDKLYRESETWVLGRDLVMKGLEDGVFERRADGAIEIDLEKEKLGRKVVLRSDGTSIYITQDIGATVTKAEENKLDGQIWVVAEEQKYHFQVLFKILEKLGHPWASNLFHLAYGLVHLPDGRMKSREGRIVDADDLLREVAELAAKEIQARDPEGKIPEDEIERRAAVIGLSSLRFMLLKVTPLSSMTFYPEESVKFEGDTGARILYAYARLQALLREGDAETPGELALLAHETERLLALDLIAFPELTARAARDKNPSLIANYMIDLVRDLNRFYDQCPILKSGDEALTRARLTLCRAVSTTLARAADLLGMPLLERM